LIHAYRILGGQVQIYGLVVQNYCNMSNHKKTKSLQVLITIPLILVSFPGGLINTLQMPNLNIWSDSYRSEISLGNLTLSSDDIVLANQIDAYYGQWDLPLEGYGKRIVIESKKHDVDPALPAAIFMRESTAGKFTCGDFNPGGFGGCTISFKNFDQAIVKIVAALGGSPEEKSGHYYEGKDLDGILKTYNSVIPAYSSEVKGIMKNIRNIQV
jgi:hypothetical protein